MPRGLVVLFVAIPLTFCWMVDQTCGQNLSAPFGLTFGPDQNLYVSSYGTDEVLRYDGTTGIFMDVFAFGGGLQPSGLVFGPDQNLYLSNYTGTPSDEVLRYDGVTGALINVFARCDPGVDCTLASPSGLAFGPDQNLYVSSSGGDEVLRFNGTTGALIDEFAAGDELAAPFALTFGPDENLYVTSATTHEVLRYDGTTGTEFARPLATLSLLDPRRIAIHAIVRF